MKKIIFPSLIFLTLFFSLNSNYNSNGPAISNLTYDSITQNSVSVMWITDTPADSKIKWMAIDSNYQPLNFTDSLYNSALVTSHSLHAGSLQPAVIYRYTVTSQNAGGETVDSGYFVTQSASTGRVDVYFNHSVDTIVSTGEKANGNQSFENLLINRINSTLYSIDITLWEFDELTAVASALINAKNRGVKIRFIYNHSPNTPLIDSLLAHGIPVLKRNYDTTSDMHNKFWIFDYRYNSSPNIKYLWTGSTNVTHPQFHSDKNNVITIQDESLCAVYTREFEEMWGSHTDLFDISRAKFGPLKIDNVPHILNAAGTRMEVYFCPSDSVSVFLSNLILTKPTGSLYFCILKFSLPAMGNAMHTIFGNGRQIKGVFDLAHSTESGCLYRQMKGISGPVIWNPPADVFIDSSEGLLHHKYFITDANLPAGNKIAVTGSYNWDSGSTYGNDENSLTIFNARVNNLYYQEFYARYRGAGGEVIGLQNTGAKIPEMFILFQNYPNPFNPETEIRFEIPVEAPVTMKIYDLLGREAAIPVNGKLKPGKYTVKWNGEGYSSGIYFYRLQSGNYSESKKMILLK